MNLIISLSGILSIICFIYYIVIISYAGFSSAFAWFWPAVGLVLGVICIVLRRLKVVNIVMSKPVKIISIVIIISGIIVFTIIEGTIIFYGSKKPSDNADYVIVLGAQIRGTEISNSLKKRLDKAVYYLEKNSSTKVIVSGGQGTGEDIPEAEAMNMYLINKGIESERIIIESESTNTYENIIFSKEFLDTDNDNVVIVTNNFHVYRGLSIAKKQGIKNVQGLSAPSDKVLTINYYVREALAVLKDKLFGNM